MKTRSYVAGIERIPVDRIEIARANVERTRMERIALKNEIDKQLQVLKEQGEAMKKGDYQKAFELSAKLAELSGVPDNEILRTKEDIDRYFLG